MLSCIFINTVPQNFVAQWSRSRLGFVYVPPLKLCAYFGVNFPRYSGDTFLFCLVRGDLARLNCSRDRLAVRTLGGRSSAHQLCKSTTEGSWGVRASLIYSGAIFQVSIAALRKLVGDIYRFRQVSHSSVCIHSVAGEANISTSLHFGYLQIDTARMRFWRSREKQAAAVPVHGVSLNYLKSLDIPPTANFQDTCNVVKKTTANSKGNRSLASFLLINPKTQSLVKTVADVFVSYAWKGTWGATMAALLDFKGNADDLFVWMDFAILDQHSTGDLDFDTWATVFRSALVKIGKAVVVMTPAEAPVATSRSWCCFEWAILREAGIPFSYTVDPQDKDRLVMEITTGKFGLVRFNNLFAGVNVENASAFKASDQVAITQLIRKIGVVDVNNVVMHSLKDFLLVIVKEAESRAKAETQEQSRALLCRAALHQSLVSSHCQQLNNSRLTFKSKTGRIRPRSSVLPRGASN